MRAKNLVNYMECEIPDDDWESEKEEELFLPGSHN